MSTEETKEEDVQEAVDAIYGFAAAMLQSGKSPAEVEDALVEKGIARETAQVVVGKLTAARADVIADANKEQGQRNMVIGALIAIVGIVITAATYSAAEGGGKYVIAWGAIIFGAIRFFRGLAQMNG